MPAVAALLAASVLASVFVSAPVHADTKRDLQAAQSTLNDLVVQIAGAAAERDWLRTQIAALLAEIDVNRRTLEATQAAEQAAQAQIDQVQAQMAGEQAALDGRAADAYEAGPSSVLATILGADSFTDLQGPLETLQMVAQSDQDLISSLAAGRVLATQARTDLQTQRGTIADVQARLAQIVTALDTAATEQAAAVARLQAAQADAEALVATLTAKRDRELAREALARAGGGSGIPLPGPPPPGTAHVRDLIGWYFAPLGRHAVNLALCVGYRESRYDPTAVNPASGAAGVFQFMPFLWPIVSKWAGRGGASVFDADANVAVAAWTVANYGWSPWNSDSGVSPM